MNRRRRAYAYITNRSRLLLFTHPDFPEVGVQVPAGTVQPEEDPVAAVMREAREETGLADLEFVGYLGFLEREMSEFGRPEIQETLFYHLRCPGNPPESWRHNETSGATVAPIRFDFFWATLPNGVPELIALNGVMLDELNKTMKNESQSRVDAQE
jgi:8-oxo-dGTP pyrophosphatase MutT (NUDIX family)